MLRLKKKIFKSGTNIERAKYTLYENDFKKSREMLFKRMKQTTLDKWRVAQN